jgi:hypothetical protein
MDESQDEQSGASLDRLPRARHVMDVGRDERRRLIVFATMRSILVAASLIALFYALPFDWSPVAQVAGGVLAGMVLIGGAGVWQLRAVATAEFPELRAIEALAFSTALLVVLFASVYLSLSHGDTEAFSEQLDHTGALYFTLTTLTTVGFGDIAAQSGNARVAVMVQMVANVAVLGIVIKLIMGVARRRMSNDDGERSDQAAAR